WLVPIGMKKSRPGHELRVLCSPDLASDLRHIIFSETGTLGIRSETIAKHTLPRHFETVEVHGHKIRIKVSPYSAKPEYEDLAEASRATGIPIRQLAGEAEPPQAEAGDRRC
ncbi:MAG: nickel insertion protein, partial [Acidimicrobiales bacterium]